MPTDCGEKWQCQSYNINKRETRNKQSGNMTISMNNVGIITKVLLLLIFVADIMQGNSTDIHATSSRNVPLKPLTVEINGQHVQLELKGDLDESAHQFCLKYDLLQPDCLTLKNYVRNLIQSNMANNAEETSTSKDRVVNTDEVAAEVDEDNDGDVANSFNYIGDIKVDYSRKVGPQLDVILDDKKLVLQTYVGESRDQAIKRFCTKHKMSEPVCGQVKDGFLALYGIVPPEVQKPGSSGENNNNNAHQQWIDQVVWDTYLYPIAHAVGIAAVMLVYLMQWRDEVAQEPVREMAD
jgi:hypothetical protein